jgi:hypothetical protein
MQGEESEGENVLPVSLNDFKQVLLYQIIIKLIA